MLQKETSQIQITLPFINSGKSKEGLLNLYGKDINCWRRFWIWNYV